MALTYTFTTTTDSAASSESLQLWHGTDMISAYWIVKHGLSKERLLQTSGAYAFCTTTDPKIACVYAGLNPARGAPVLLGLKVPPFVLQDFRINEPPWVLECMEDKAYEFLPETFLRMNTVITDLSVREVTELDLPFNQ